MPILKPFYYRTYGKAYVKARSIYKSLENLSIHIRRKYMDMIKGYEKGVIRHFCDALIEAKVEAINENKEWAPHLMMIIYPSLYRTYFSVSHSIIFKIINN